jgi:hypothetical protein
MYALVAGDDYARSTLSDPQTEFDTPCWTLHRVHLKFKWCCISGKHHLHSASRLRGCDISERVPFWTKWCRAWFALECRLFFQKGNCWYSRMDKLLSIRLPSVNCQNFSSPFSLLLTSFKNSPLGTSNPHKLPFWHFSSQVFLTCVARGCTC